MYNKFKITVGRGSTVSINRELNMSLMNRREEQSMHVEYSHEYGFYESIAAGNVEAVKAMLASPSDIDMYEGAEYGRLSADPLQNMRYHFVISAALITRTCVGKGMERELAYTLSDLYIGKMDALSDRADIIALHNEMMMDYAVKMSELPKQGVYSSQVIKVIDHICHHLNEKITVQDAARVAGINRSYLSALFVRETGMYIRDFIMREKVKAAENMLKFSDYSYADIAEYFGFSSQSHFIKCFKEETGVTPLEYRRKFSRDHSGQQKPLQ